jgi:hypothetical protein
MGVEAARRDLEDIAPPLSATDEELEEPGEEADPYTLGRGQGRGTAHTTGRFSREGERDPAAVTTAARAAMDGVEPEYLALVDPDSFQPVQNVNGRVLLAVAARIGATRLIDNTIIHTAATPDGAPTT